MDSGRRGLTLTNRSPGGYSPLPVQGNILAIVVLAAVSAAQDQAPPKNPFAGDAGAAAAGRVAFRMACAGCHGLSAKGGREGPDLTRGTYPAAETDDSLFRFISTGAPGTPMPGFRGSLDNDSIWRVVSYIRSLTRPGEAPLTGDRTAGEKLFWGKGACGQCHRVEARGEAIGPDLTRAGRQRSISYLRESVVSPDADLTPGYATITVVTRGGKKITGVERSYDNFTAQFVDLGGAFHSFARDSVRSMTREYRSLMPSDYGRLLNQRELDDLLAYLAGLGRER